MDSPRSTLGGLTAACPPAAHGSPIPDWAVGFYIFSSQVATPGQRIAQLWSKQAANLTTGPFRLVAD